jgi:hypothetical protein
MLKQHKWEYTGSPSELLAALDEVAGEQVTRQRGWPRTPQHLGGLLRRVAPVLRRAGVLVEVSGPEGHDRRRTVRITRLPSSRSSGADQRSHGTQRSQVGGESAPSSEMGEGYVDKAV